MSKKEDVLLPKGTEIRISKVGYYSFWYPDEKPIILKEDVVAHPATTEAKFSKLGGFLPYVVSVEIADTYGSPIAILWA